MVSTDNLTLHTVFSFMCCSWEWHLPKLPYYEFQCSDDIRKHCCAPPAPHTKLALQVPWKLLQCWQLGTSWIRLATAQKNRLGMGSLHIRHHYPVWSFLPKPSNYSKNWQQLFFSIPYVLSPAECLILITSPTKQLSDCRQGPHLRPALFCIHLLSVQPHVLPSPFSIFPALPCCLKIIQHVKMCPDDNSKPISDLRSLGLIYRFMFQQKG